MPQPYKLFTIYAREDAQYLEELRGQLRPLEHAGRIKVWSDREINPGVDWEREIVQNLDTADIILILVSAAYYNSAYIHEKEIKYAINRHERGETKVLPVIVRPCHFLDDPVISRLQVLPTDGKPVTDRRHWQERDDAWLDVVAGVKKTLNLLDADISDKEQAKEQEKQAARRREREAKERAENEHLAQIRREQEAAARRAELDTWQQAADDHNLPAYETYLARYPQGEYAREARARIKELKRKNANPLVWERYAIIGGGVLALMLLVWLVSEIFGVKKEQTAQNQSVQQDSTQLSESSPSDNFKKDTPTTVQVEKPNETKTSSPSSSNESKPSIVNPPPSTISFNYPMVRVAGGTFMMGSPASEKGRDDECQHQVPVSSFSIGKYEVTQAQWRAVMGTNPSNFKGCDDCPVEQVSWNDVQSFIKKLKEKTGKTYRLPTEAEWEYAARGGNKSKGFLYAGSSNLGNVAWYVDNSGSRTHAVGGKSPNELGLYDMSGNVWEWCQDIYKPYPGCSRTEEGRVSRGGSWDHSSYNCRAAARDYDVPDGGFVGFRLALQ